MTFDRERTQPGDRSYVALHARSAAGSAHAFVSSSNDASQLLTSSSLFLLTTSRSFLLASFAIFVCASANRCGRPNMESNPAKYAAAHALVGVCLAGCESLVASSALLPSRPSLAVRVSVFRRSLFHTDEYQLAVALSLGSAIR